MISLISLLPWLGSDHHRENFPRRLFIKFWIWKHFSVFNLQHVEIIRERKHFRGFWSLKQQVLGPGIVKGERELKYFSLYNIQGASQWKCPKRGVNPNTKKNFTYPALITLRNLLTQDVVEAKIAKIVNEFKLGATDLWEVYQGNYNIPDVTSSSGSHWATDCWKNSSVSSASYSFSLIICFCWRKNNGLEDPWSHLFLVSLAAQRTWTAATANGGCNKGLQMK